VIRAADERQMATSVTAGCWRSSVDRHRLAGGGSARAAGRSWLSTLAGPGVCFLASIFLSSGVLHESMAASAHAYAGGPAADRRPTALAGKRPTAGGRAVQLGVYLAIVSRPARGSVVSGIPGRRAWAVLCLARMVYACSWPRLRGDARQPEKKGISLMSPVRRRASSCYFDPTSPNSGGSQLVLASAHGAGRADARMGSGPVSWVEMTVALSHVGHSRARARRGCCVAVARVQSGGRLTFKGKGQGKRGRVRIVAWVFHLSQSTRRWPDDSGEWIASVPPALWPVACRCAPELGRWYPGSLMNRRGSVAPSPPSSDTSTAI
jgi:hypothetical protein